MPLARRCGICGRLCEEHPHDARPYQPKGYACDKCYAERVIPSRMWKQSKGYRYGV